VTTRRKRPTAAQKRRARRLRIIAWLVILAVLVLVGWWFLNLETVWKVLIVAGLVLLVAGWWVWTRRHAIREEMDRRAGE
jgi:Flp pilus assembly protein TadB